MIVSLHCDSQTGIRIEDNSIYSGTKRHIHIRHGAVKQLLKHGVISLEHMRFKRNLVNPHIKEVTKRVVLRTLRGMRLNPIDSSSMVNTHLWANRTTIALICIKFPAPWHVVLLLRGFALLSF